ncbi:MAG: hypothetical protein ACQESZ_06715 [Bacteroidota bacterium]
MFNFSLYTQIAGILVKQMHHNKVMNLAEFLKDYELTHHTAAHFKTLVNFNVDEKMPQRKQVIPGKILSRIIAANYYYF